MNPQAVSSTRFETELGPQRHLRNSLLLCSASATLAGVLLIATLPLLPQIEALFGLLWLWRGALEFRHQRCGMRRLERIRLNPGSLQALAGSGEPQALELLPGSVVLSRIAWLRLRFEDGLEYGELLSGDARSEEDWRRLQLIWRQQGPVFGRSRGS